MIYDTAVIGTGPAGLSAALTLKLHGRSVLWFGSGSFSDKVGRAEKIANYPGLPMVSGEELNRSFALQAQELGLEITESRVTNAAALEDRFMLLADNEMYEARTLLIAAGASPAGILEGEERLLGRGVSYCATCDGFMYRDRPVAVFCTDAGMAHDIRYLEETASKVYLYTSFSYDPVSENTVRLSKPIRTVDGEMKADRVILSDGTEFETDCLFILRSAVAPAVLFPGIVTEDGHIVTDRRQETNFPGCFAAGDCTGRPYQIGKAVGEGNVAAHSILELLDRTGR